MRLHGDAKADLIRRVPLFSECSKRELAEVASLADELDLPSGSHLTEEGALGREFLVIIEGTAEVRHDDQVIADLGPGDFAGEMALVTGAPRTATVAATSDMRALVLSHQAFRQLMADSPSVKGKIDAAVSERRAKT